MKLSPVFASNAINSLFREPLEEIKDIYDHNIELIVKLQDDREYVVLVVTPKNFLSLMDKEGIYFLPAACPFIIVRKLTKQVIEQAIHAHAEHDNSYWIKLHHFAIDIEDKMFEELQKKEDDDNE